MKSTALARAAFGASAVYDLALGAAFLLAPAAVFTLAHVTPPNHYGYVQFPAALLMLFGGMFLRIAQHPIRNRLLMPYGMLFKLAYVGVVARYWFTSGLPLMWKPFAVADAVFFVAFLLAWRATPARPMG